MDFGISGAARSPWWTRRTQTLRWFSVSGESGMAATDHNYSSPPVHRTLYPSSNKAAVSFSLPHTFSVFPLLGWFAEGNKVRHTNVLLVQLSTTGSGLGNRNICAAHLQITGEECGSFSFRQPSDLLEGQKVVHVDVVLCRRNAFSERFLQMTKLI